jgi:hypothetical protein
MSAEAVPAGPPLGDWAIVDVDALPERDGVRYELVDAVPRLMTPPAGSTRTRSSSCTWR